MSKLSEALRGNQNAAGPRGVKGIGAKVGDAAKKGLRAVSSGLSTAAGNIGLAKAVAKPAISRAVGTAKQNIGLAKAVAKPMVANAGSKLAALGEVAMQVKSRMPAANKDRARVNANRSAFIRSERNAGNAAEAKSKTTAGKIEAGVAEAKYQGNKAVRSVKKTASTIGSAVDETYGKRARQAGGAIKRFVKKTYSSGG